jgi:hypothetical protein
VAGPARQFECLARERGGPVQCAEPGQQPREEGPGKKTTEKQPRAGRRLGGGSTSSNRRRQVGPARSRWVTPSAARTAPLLRGGGRGPLDGLLRSGSAPAGRPVCSLWSTAPQTPAPERRVLAQARDRARPRARSPPGPPRRAPASATATCRGRSCSPPPAAGRRLVRHAGSRPRRGEVRARLAAGRPARRRVAARRLERAAASASPASARWCASTSGSRSATSGRSRSIASAARRCSSRRRSRSSMPCAASRISACLNA